LRRRYFINGKLSQAFGGWVVVVVVFMSALFMFIKLKSHPLVRGWLDYFINKATPYYRNVVVVKVVAVMLLSFVMVSMCKCKYIFLEKTQNGNLFFCFSGLEYNLSFFTHLFETSRYGFVGIRNVFLLPL
jgi:hypothetical protein